MSFVKDNFHCGCKFIYGKLARNISKAQKSQQYKA